MSGTEKSHVALLDELAALDPAQRCEVAKELRQVAEDLRRGDRRWAHRPHSPAVSH